MTDFSKLMEKAKEIESKMKESQENIKKIEVKFIESNKLMQMLKDFLKQL